MKTRIIGHGSISKNNDGNPPFEASVFAVITTPEGQEKSITIRIDNLYTEAQYATSEAQRLQELIENHGIEVMTSRR